MALLANATRWFASLAFAGGLTSAAQLLAAAATSPARPNILFILRVVVDHASRSMFGVRAGESFARGKEWDTDRVLCEQILPKIDEVARQANLPLIGLNTAFADAQALMPDGVHPNTAGAALMTRTIYTALTGRPAAAK